MSNDEISLLSAPENAPSSVECTAVSSTSLRVGWQPLTAPRHGTEILGYTVLYASEGECSTCWIFIEFKLY